MKVHNEPARPTPDLTLVQDTQSFIERFVSLKPEQALVEAIWAIMTWALGPAQLQITSYLYISSKGPGTGKTRNMDVLASLVRNPDTGTDSPVHVLAQEIATSQPTLFLDEIDTVFNGRAGATGLKRVLNIGYMRGAVIKRQRGLVIEKWQVFCAKVLAGIRNNHLPEALLSRTIPIEMEKRKGKLERFSRVRIESDSQRADLLTRIEEFVNEFGMDIAQQRPKPIKSLDDRQNEIVEPLLQIATVLGQEPEVREALEEVFSSGQGESQQASKERDLLSRIRQAFAVQAAQGGSDEFILSDDLTAALGTVDVRTLSINLNEMGFIRSKRERRIGNKVKQGYARADFEPLFSYWLDEPADTNDDNEGDEL